MQLILKKLQEKERMWWRERREKAKEVKYWQLKNCEEGHKWILCTILANFPKV